MSRWALLVLVACGKKEPYTPSFSLELPPSDVPIPRKDGPVAGPRAVVDAPPPPPVPEGTPGGGPMPAYVTTVRRAVSGPLDSCLANGPALVVGQAALVVARLDAAGRLLSYEVKRPSGVEGFDGCLARAFETATFEAPPAEVVADGQVELPEMAFR